MKTNEFAKMKKLVEETINDYRHVRKVCNIADDGWHSASIEQKAKPFINGYFTLAVVGKVSSGKSTFINALLGCKDFLPTGHDQTTCGLTYIEYGEKPEATITFGDEHTHVLDGDINEQIKNYVALPEKYRLLPLNKIDEMILGGLDLAGIWNAHEQLEKETQCAPIDKDLLEEYVSQREKKNIVKKVHIKYPFNKELRDWRIIDSPGIGAIGGIEERTRQMLALQKEDCSREVDAIIFLQNGNQTLDQTDTKKFVSEQLDSFTESDKHRLFYVLTHSSSVEFRNYKDSKLEFIKKNYGDKIKYLTYADSLLFSFINHIEKSGDDLKEYDDIQQPSNWSNDEWEVIMGILDQAKRQIKKSSNEVAFNNDTMRSVIEEWANFDELKSKINDFAKKEKEEALRNLLDLVAKDYLNFQEQLEHDEKIVFGDIEDLNSIIEEVTKKKREYNFAFQKIENSFNIDGITKKFDFINHELNYFDNLYHIPALRTAITNLFDRVQREERYVFRQLMNEFSDNLKNYNPRDITLQSIDFENIERNATSLSHEKYVIEPERVEKQTSEEDKRIPAKYGTRINEEQKLRRFKTLVLKQARNQRDIFLYQLREKCDNMIREVKNELNKKLIEENNHYEELKTQLARKDEFKLENHAKIKMAEETSKKLLKLVEDHGIKI